MKMKFVGYCVSILILLSSSAGISQQNKQGGNNGNSNSNFNIIDLEAGMKDLKDEMNNIPAHTKRLPPPNAVQPAVTPHVQTPQPVLQTEIQPPQPRREIPEREGLVKMKGVAKTLVGHPVKDGDFAPEFSAVDTNFSPVHLSSFIGNTVIISAVPSLDTSVCSVQTKKFNEEIAKLPENIKIITISSDLPFAQKRFCNTEKTDKMIFLSDAARHEFGVRYGVYIKDMGILARSVFVIDGDDNVVYNEIVPEISSEPDYQKALEAARKAAGTK